MKNLFTCFILLSSLASISTLAASPDDYVKCGITYGNQIIKVNGSSSIPAYGADDTHFPGVNDTIKFGPSNRYELQLYRYSQTDTHSQMNIDLKDNVLKTKSNFIFYMESYQVNQKSSYETEFSNGTKLAIYCSIK